MERMEQNVNDFRRNVQFNTQVTPQTSFQGNGNNEQYVYAQQEIGDRLNESAQQRQNSYREEIRPVINTEGNRSTRKREEVSQYSQLRFLSSASQGLPSSHLRNVSMNSTTHANI